MELICRLLELLFDAVEVQWEVETLAVFLFGHEADDSVRLIRRRLFTSCQHLGTLTEVAVTRSVLLLLLWGDFPHPDYLSFLLFNLVGVAHSIQNICEGASSHL